MTAINAITFDLWQTLILDSPELGRPRSEKRLRGIMDALGRDGYRFAEEEVREAFRSCYKICDDVRTAEGDVTFDEQIDIFLRQIDGGLAEDISPETWVVIARRYADSYLDHPPEIAPCAEEVLGGVKRLGWKVGLICNTGSTPGVTQRVFLERAGLARYFDTLVFSDEERLSKPAERIFDLTLARLGVRPEETIHVGDHHRNDVFGAKRAGLQAIWIKREGQPEPSVAPDAQIDALRETLEALEGMGAAGVSLDSERGST